MNQAITFLDVCQWIGQHIVELLLIVGIFVEITPIKFSPITFTLNLLFKPLKKDMDDMKKELNENIQDVKVELKKDIDSIRQEQIAQSNTITELIKSFEMEEISSIRWSIIEFSRSIDNNQLHTRDEYLHIKDLNSRYHDLIKKYDLTNGLLDEEMEKILTHYDENKNCNSVYF